MPENTSQALPLVDRLAAPTVIVTPEIHSRNSEISSTTPPIPAITYP